MRLTGCVYVDSCLYWMAGNAFSGSLQVLILPLWAPCRIARECPARARYDMQLTLSRAVGRGHGILNYCARGGSPLLTPMEYGGCAAVFG